jgi:coenzyme F420-dependent glucose-6-phosphate dehydrogenase
MLELGYHVSHEQFSPSSLLQYVQKAEQAGFQFALSSDHFYPWNNAQGHSGYAWSWLGAAMATTSLPMGVVTCPYHRYHPAIIAQAVGTLLEMFPERFWVAVGSGQMLNESIVGKPWPQKSERNQALKDSIEVMRKLWDGEEVNYEGLFKVQDAKLYTKPAKKPLVFGAALTPKTAKFLASWADGVITVNKPLEELKEFVKTWKENGGADKPMALKMEVSYHEDIKKAKEMAFEQWKTNIFESDLLTQLKNPSQFEQAAKYVRPDDLDEHVLIGNEPQFFVDQIEAYKELGFSKISIHNINKEQEPFMDFFGEKVLSQF